MECIFCGTDTGEADGYCIECESTAEDMGLDYNELKGTF